MSMPSPETSSIATAATTTTGAPRDTALALFRSMALIRTVEERLIAEYRTRRIRGPIHLSLGQEAAAAGVLGACRPGDACVSTHRNHAHYLAKGGSLQGMVDELYGLASGCCGGWGGSMHLADPSVNMLVSSAIVAGSIPIAAGIAFQLKRAGGERVCVAFGGDGATDEGVFYETLNLAALLPLPVLFVVENNGISTLTPLAARQAAPQIVPKAEAFGVPGLTVEGHDVLGVHEAAHEALARIRRTSEPMLLEVVTDRLCAHVGPVSELATSEPDAALQARLDREPLVVFRGWLRAERPEWIAEAEALERAVRHEVDAAFERAIAQFEAEAARVHLPSAPPPPDPRRV
jgi:pyruvate dehydrogenase E1 component alpha subunit